MRYFMQVAEDLHFGRAAQKLNMSQPSLSQQVRLLEQEIEIRLFDRNSRSVALTTAGSIFLPQAKAAVEQAQLALDTAARLASGEAGELAIGFNPSVPLVPIVAGALRTFQQTYPGLHLRWSEDTGASQIAAVASHALDLSLLRRAVAPRVPEGLTVSAVITEPLFVACHDTHRFAALDYVVWKDLDGEKLIAYDIARPDGFSGEITALMQGAGAWPGSLHSVNDLVSLLALVIANLGIAVLPQSMQVLRPDGMTFVSLEAAQVDIWLIRRKSDLPTPAMRFLELLGSLG